MDIQNISGSDVVINGFNANTRINSENTRIERQETREESNNQEKEKGNYIDTKA